MNEHERIAGILDVTGATFPTPKQRQDAIGGLTALLREVEHDAVPRVDFNCHKCGDVVPVAVRVQLIEQGEITDEELGRGQVAGFRVSPDLTDVEAHFASKHDEGTVMLFTEPIERLDDYGD